MASDLNRLEWAMDNLAAGGISFEVVEDHPPPDRTREPPPVEDDGSAKKAVGVASPERVADSSRRVPLSEWQRALREAEDLSATEHHVALAVVQHMRYRDENGDVRDAHCWPSPETLAAETHRSRTVVYEALAGLEAKGWIFRERRPGGASSVIWATVPEVRRSSDSGAEKSGQPDREIRPTGQRSPANRTQK